MSFKYKAYLPTLDKFVDMTELSTQSYINIVKYISNRDDELIVEAFEDIIKSRVTKSVYNKLTRLDKFFILCTVRSICIGPFLSLTFEDEKSKKQYTSRVNIIQILQSIDNITEKYTRNIKVSDNVSLTLGCPRHLSTSSEHELLLSCISNIIIGKTNHNFVDMTDSQKGNIIDSLPTNVLPRVVEYIEDINRSYGEVVMFKKVNPYIDAAETEEYTVNMFDNSLISFLITCYTENLKSIYEIIYVLVKRLNFSGEFVHSSTFAEVKMYLDLYEDEMKEQEKAMQDQQQSNQGSSPAPIGNPVAPNF
tara:strand:+ start:7212 stop:8132 length:921 start_codon:yes stop_codon:yes gene_type:complete